MVTEGGNLEQHSRTNNPEDNSSFNADKIASSILTAVIPSLVCFRSDAPIMGI